MPCLLPIWQQRVCSQKWILEKDLVSKRNSGSKVDLEGVQDSQSTLEAQTETREEPQGVVEAPLMTQGPQSIDRTRSQRQRYGSLIIENKDVLTHRAWWAFHLSRSYRGSQLWEMGWSHEGWDAIHVWQQGMDLSWCTWRCKSRRVQVGFEEKTDMDGNINVFKARLVAKGLRNVMGWRNVLACCNGQDH